MNSETTTLPEVSFIFIAEPLPDNVSKHLVLQSRAEALDKAINALRVFVEQSIAADQRCSVFIRTEI